MRALLLMFSVAICLTAFGSIANAQIPDEVMKPYKRYQEAVAQNDYERANKAALDAMEASERVLGDSKETGDLAYNYARLARKVVTVKENARRSAAHKRAIALGRFYPDPEQAAKVTLDRHIAFITYQTETIVNSRRDTDRADANVDFIAFERDIDRLGYRGTVYEAHMETLRAAHYLKNEDYFSAVQYGREAKEILARLDERPSNRFQIKLHMDLATALQQIGYDLDAALIVQHNFKSPLVEQLTNETLKTSQSLWRKSWRKLRNDRVLDEAYAQGLCRCVKLEDAKGRPQPIEQVPAMIPPKSDRSAEAILLLDVAADGTTENIRVAAQSERSFGKAAVKAAQDFIYVPALDNFDPQTRKDIPVRFVLTLKNEYGNIFKSRGLKTKVELTKNQDLLSDSHTIYSTGSRISVR